MHAKSNQVGALKAQCTKNTKYIGKHQTLKCWKPKLQQLGYVEKLGAIENL